MDSGDRCIGKCSSRKNATEVSLLLWLGEGGDQSISVRYSTNSVYLFLGFGLGLASYPGLGMRLG